MFAEFVKTFVVGGLICVVGQLLIDLTKLTPARIVVLFVTAGVILTGVGVYPKLVEYAGCGATVPIVGFGYLLATGTKQAIAEMGLMGAMTGGVTAAAGGITAAVFFGYLFALLCRPAEKK
ncbi:stage V sporulation protein AE [Clostridiales bacterium BX7]|uniref:Stage V sporulation protein AE n=2 Tax=Feifania hominis TaxID=2763660 RepID=A0A926DFJ5_9FIRM|nr:stage V sporulation protein AE [Feifania hominis]